MTLFLLSVPLDSVVYSQINWLCSLFFPFLSDFNISLFTLLIYQSLKVLCIILSNSYFLSTGNVLPWYVVFCLHLHSFHKVSEMLTVILISLSLGISICSNSVGKVTYICTYINLHVLHIYIMECKVFLLWQKSVRLKGWDRYLS